ncbi:hypothetical protein PHYSODRAFT_505125, partial [Phytophthora sojae]
APYVRKATDKCIVPYSGPDEPAKPPPRPTDRYTGRTVGMPPEHREYTATHC